VVAEDKFSYAELLQVLELIKSTPQFSEVHLKIGDIEIDLSRGDSQPGTSVKPVSSSARALMPTASKAESRPAEQAAEEQSQRPKPAIPTQQWSAGTNLVRSPMVGTFYRAPAPGAPPFVEVGQVVETNTTVCIIEVMKLMSSISAGTRGKITQILANNAELVEYDQVLMVIELM
jgi:acetyl-CoA carboxylase biotin carboxyl carrier protein